MKKYAWMCLVACFVLIFSSTAFASHGSVSYFARDGKTNLGFDAKLDLNERSTIAGNYVMIDKGAFEASCDYRMALLDLGIALGPVMELKYAKNSQQEEMLVGGGLFFETAKDKDISIYGKATYLTNLDRTKEGIFAGIGTKFMVAKPIFIKADASMSFTQEGNNTLFGLGAGLNF